MGDLLCAVNREYPIRNLYKSLEEIIVNEIYRC